MKTIVVYYSRKGSNKYLAVKIASSLKCDIEEIRPRLNLFLLFLMNVHLGIGLLKKELRNMKGLFYAVRYGWVSLFLLCVVL